MNIIVAVGKDFGIGYNNDLIYNIPEDKKFFRKTTLNKVVVMGRKTFLSLPNSAPLKNRTNIVLSKDKNFSAEGITVCHSVEELMDCLKQYNSDDVYVIGGAEIYALLIDKCENIIITRINNTKQADKFFPDIDKMKEWKLCDISEDYDYEGTSYRFCCYKKVK